jgi:hypothetical protein
MCRRRHKHDLRHSFAGQQTGKTPSQLHVDDLDARLISSFLVSMDA